LTMGEKCGRGVGAREGLAKKIGKRRQKPGRPKALPKTTTLKLCWCDRKSIGRTGLRHHGDREEGAKKETCTSWERDANRKGTGVAKLGRRMEVRAKSRGGLP